MHRTTHLLGTLVATSLALAGLTACGSSNSGTATQASSDGSSGGPIVAQVGSSSITRSTLSHWMATIVGGDYDESLSHPAPKGLVSDPPNYPRCVAAIETIGPPKTTTETPQQIHSGLVGDCHQLYESLKQQALAYLIQGLWSVAEGAEEGIVVSSAEIQKAFERLKAERYPKEAELAAYLAGREWSVSDELYLIKRDLLDARIGAKHEQALRKTVKGGREALERAVLELAIHNQKNWIAKTSCSPGYVVISECKQYKGPETNGAPDALLEQITASR
ncbi:MAG TPA: hypothetical protein VN892_15370 [Solirubrobacteraceae bacterium]|nr:hypothetical protein [Solirubrobacteraceae bacterium]